MLAFSEAALAAWISDLLWPFFRVLALFSVAPILSSRAFPVRIRVLLALMIAWAVSGASSASPELTIRSPQAWNAVAHEVLVGLSIGFVARLVFAAMELAGEIIGLSMGLNFAGFFDPVNNSQGSALASLFGHMSALIFVAVNGHLLVLLAVVRSYERLPVGGQISDVVSGLRVFEFGSQVFASAFWLALPLTALMLMVNLALGILSRVAPQLNFFAVGFPITLAVGLAGLLLVLPLIDRAMIDLLERGMDFLWRGGRP